MNLATTLLISFLFFLTLPIMILSTYLVPIVLITMVILLSIGMTTTFIIGKLSFAYDRYQIAKTFCPNNFKRQFKALLGNFESLQLQNSLLKNAILSNTILNKSNLSNVNANGAIFEGTQLRHAILRFSNCQRSIFKRANLNYSNLIGSNFTNANFKDASLISSNLERANLKNCNLSNVNAKKVWLANSNLNNSNLNSSNFSGANLCGANLSSCKTLNTNFNKALFNGKTKLPFSMEEAKQRGMYYIPEINQSDTKKTNIRNEIRYHKNISHNSSINSIL